MAFVSIFFIIFVSVVILAYFLTPKKYQWLTLLVASYVFFWLNSEWLLFAMFATTLVTFLVGRRIGSINASSKQYLLENADTLDRAAKKEHKTTTKKRAKRVMLLGVFFDLGMLLFLKYYNFFAENINGLIAPFVHNSGALPYLSLLLPIGISFYTLQAMAYMIDIYRGKNEADSHFGKFMLFMSFFPQIVQGPIARHNQLAHQLYEGHSFDYKRFKYGMQLMLWGFMKKLIIADRMAVPVNQLFDNYSDYTGPILFLAAAMYGLQVYADFSGGIDIARGVAQIMGIDMEQNFNQPYFSKSIEDFWRRWHMTLGGWMRDYVFYPLSLSKKFAGLSRVARKIFGSFFGKRLPAFLAMFIVYFLIGFWHGSSWKYIAYGVWNGIFIMAGILLGGIYEKAREKCGIPAESITWKVFQVFRTFILITIGRYFSRAASLMVALRMMKRTLVNWWDFSFITNGALIELGLDTANWVLLVLALLTLFAVDLVHERGISLRDVIARQGLIFRWIIYLAAVLCVIVLGVYGPGYDAASFIYEQC